MMSYGPDGIAYSDSKIKELRQLSYSSLDNFQRCAYLWFLNQTEPRQPTGLSLLFGRAAHRMIDRLILAREEKDESLNVAKDWKAIWNSEVSRAEEKGGIDWEGEFPATPEGDGLRIFSTPAVREAIDKIVPKKDEAGYLIERQITLRVPGVPIPVTGYVDMVDKDGTVLDFKTANRAWDERRAEREVQPLYYLAAALQAGEPGTRFIHYVFTRAKTPQVQVFETQRSAADVLWLLTAIRENWEAIKTGVFPKNMRACYDYNRPCIWIKKCRGEGA